MNRTLATVLAGMLAAIAPAADAATTCRIVSTGSFQFGSYDTLSAVPADTVVTVQVQCTRSGGPTVTSVTLTLDPGANGTSVSNRRTLQTGGTGDLLSYGLFRDAGRSSVWGMTPGVDAPSVQLTIPNHGSAQANFTVYGRMPALQNVSPGTYTDRVGATLMP